jgi:adhesin HecA-like repeat protein
MAVGNGKLLDLIGMTPVERQPEGVVHVDQNSNVLSAQGALYARGARLNNRQAFIEATQEVQPSAYYSAHRRDKRLELDGRERGVFRDPHDFAAFRRWLKGEPVIALNAMNIMNGLDVGALAKNMAKRDMQVTFLNLTNVFEYTYRRCAFQIQHGGSRQERQRAASRLNFAIAGSVRLLGQLPLHPEVVIAESSTQRLRVAELGVLVHRGLKNYKRSLQDAFDFIRS